MVKSMCYTNMFKFMCIDVHNHLGNKSGTCVVNLDKWTELT